MQSASSRSTIPSTTRSRAEPTPMSRCPDSARIAAYLDDRLFEEERRALEEHFASCETCWRVFADSVASLAEMRAADTASPSPERRLSLLRAALSRHRRWTAAAAGVVVAAGAAG